MTSTFKRWVLISLVVYIGLEVLLGGVLGYLLNQFVSHPFQIRLELILMVVSYFIGGLVIGLISREVRLLEPAVGAFLAVGLTFLYAFFTPVHFFGFSPQRIMIGGAIAFALALLGADLGERIAGRLGNRASKDYTRRSS